MNPAFILKPNCDAYKCEYEKTEIAGLKNYMGYNSLSTYDIDGDGWLELLAPSYFEDEIKVFKMSAPATLSDFLLN